MLQVALRTKYAVWVLQVLNKSIGECRYNVAALAESAVALMQGGLDQPCTFPLQELEEPDATVAAAIGEVRALHGL
jgi:hypothetical protein